MKFYFDLIIHNENNENIYIIQNVHPSLIVKMKKMIKYFQQKAGIFIIFIIMINI